MKKYLPAINEILRTFIIILGIEFLLLMIRALFEYPNDSISRYDMKTCLMAAVVFSLAHVFIFTDYIVERMSIKNRCIISFLPCANIAARIVYEFTNSSMLGLRSDEYSQAVQVFDMNFSIVVGAALILISLFIIEMQFKKIGKVYDIALEKYKKKREDNNFDN